MVNRWILNTPGVIDQLNYHPKQPTIKKPNMTQYQRKLRLRLYLDGLDKMDSHYCRRHSKKKYIAATFRSKAELFDEYKKYIVDNGYGQSVSYFLFSEVFEEENLALFKLAVFVDE